MGEQDQDSSLPQRARAQMEGDLRVDKVSGSVFNDDRRMNLACSENCAVSLRSLVCNVQFRA